MSDPALFPQPRRRIGQSEALLAKTLRAWHTDGYLAGDAWASARGVLRDCARAVDASRDDMRTGDGSAYSFARTVKIYADLLALYRDGQGVTSGDSFDALLAEISVPPVRNSADA
jgi:hypothetical protein